LTGHPAVNGWASNPAGEPFGRSQRFNFVVQLLLFFSASLGTDLAAFERFFLGAQTQGYFFNQLGAGVAILARGLEFAGDWWAAS
jgi:hypothetical protein